MIVTVTTTMMSAKTNKPMWFVLEVAEDTIADATETLAEDGIIYGESINTHRQGQRTVETSREPMSIGVGVIATIRGCHLDFEAAQ
jgi:hypothetical protein